MSYCTKGINFKKTEKYKIFRRFICDLLGQPNYTDRIVNGVSFKWYLNEEIKTNIPRTNEKIRKFLIEKIPKEYNYNVEIKIIPSGSCQYRYRDDSLRILVRQFNRRRVNES